ncbi:S-adenosyl-L-methionine-dependent methyltransferase [Flagelloscypha sp. PMI_526]|nr:S-adenosyl-L-methionine-dependent methyltransferase [Flagelloscypha sp. PMI_526]
MTAPADNLPKYFTNLAQLYPRQTSNTTRSLFAQILNELDPINGESVIHDNASGPAIATSELVPLAQSASAKIVATDFVPAMVDATNGVIQDNGWQDTVEAHVMNSLDLKFPDSHFTHSITNFSVFNFVDTLKGMQEIHRTLKPGGQAVVTTWKRWYPGEAIHAIQKRIRPDLPLMQLSGPEWYSDSAVHGILEKAGFKEIRVIEKSVVVQGEEGLQGLTEFLTGKFTEAAKVGWTEDEKARWETTLNEVIEEEKTIREGGVQLEMWALICRK